MLQVRLLTDIQNKISDLGLPDCHKSAIFLQKKSIGKGKLRKPIHLQMIRPQSLDKK